MRNSYKYQMFEKIVKSPMLKNSESRYSDLPFYILKYYYEKKFNKDLSLIVQDQVINPLSLKNTSYFPLKVKNKAKIVPSEIDDYYRNASYKMQSDAMDRTSATMTLKAVELARKEGTDLKFINRMAQHVESVKRFERNRLKAEAADNLIKRDYQKFLFGNMISGTNHFGGHISLKKKTFKSGKTILKNACW